MSQDYNDIMQHLCERLETLSGGTRTPVEPDMNLIDAFALDSIKVLNLVMELEDDFDISIPINALTDVHTVRDLAELIQKLDSGQ